MAEAEAKAATAPSQGGHASGEQGETREGTGPVVGNGRGNGAAATAAAAGEEAADGAGGPVESGGLDEVAALQAYNDALAAIMEETGMASKVGTRRGAGVAGAGAQCQAACGARAAARPVTGGAISGEGTVRRERWEEQASLAEQGRSLAGGGDGSKLGTRCWGWNVGEEAARGLVEVGGLMVAGAVARQAGRGGVRCVAWSAGSHAHCIRETGCETGTLGGAGRRARGLRVKREETV